MSSRTALSPNTELRFGPDICFLIKNEVGRGGSCIVYEAVYRTNAGDEKLVRIKECYPFDIPLEREPSGALTCPDSAVEQFTNDKARMYEDFRLCNRLFYSETYSDAIINTINIYEANNTVYVVSAWARENVLSSLKLDSLRDCVSIVRQTAFAIDSIHQAGYLYLDIKPDNISVINSSSKRIQLFDFNSLIPVSALHEGFTSLLSYTKGFAALEMRRGHFSKLNFYTDIYGIGALLFFLLFKRTPEAPECVQGAAFDFTKMSFPDSYPDKLILHLNHFFHKTLAAFPPDRWQTMNEVIQALEVIEKLSDPVYSYLISTPINTPPYVIGRSREIEFLETWNKNDSQQNLFLTGMGGIGKSTIVRHFLSEHRSEWDSVAFLYFNGNLRHTITDDVGMRINGTERLPEEKETDYFERKLNKIREILSRDHVLLVIDNFENRHDLILNQILDLNCRKIFITRQSMGSLNLPVLKLGAIQGEDDLLRLFIHYLDREATLDEVPVIRDILHQLDGHTLAIELFARQISNSFLTLSEASELLRKQGVLQVSSERVDYLRDNRISYEQLQAIIMRLFETDSLSVAQVTVLKALTLFPVPGIEIHEFMRLAGMTPNSGLLPQLIRYGWVNRHDDQIFLHSLIRDVIRNLLQSDHTVYIGAHNILRTLYLEITAESHKEEINLRLPDNIPSELRNTDHNEIITDCTKLLNSVSLARRVIDATEKDSQIAGCPLSQKLYQAMVVNLPKHEDEAILDYGKRLLEHPEHLSSLEILEVVEPVEKALLARMDFEAAIQLMDRAEIYAADERTKAEFCGLMCNIYDYRDAPGDQEEMLHWLESGIDHARLAPYPERKHLLAEYLLGKLNAFLRMGIEDDAGIEALILELMDIIKKECLPYSEIRCGFAVAMGFYWAELGKNHKEADKWIALARAIGEKLYPIGLDFIDNCIIPPAIMYLDLKDFAGSMSKLLEGIRICDTHTDMVAYRRKKHDLRHYLLDVYVEKGDYALSRELLSLYDEDSRQYGFPDAIDSVVRQFLQQD